jgi:CheY-like chemotaxis protein
LLCDIKLPDGEAWELAEKARERGVPAIAVTGLGMPWEVERSRMAGFSAHLVKPVDFRDLERVILDVTQNQNASVTQLNRRV